uniref:Putative 3-dehydroquinate dehydratase/shikimate dehydrogenase n=1 Tax=Rhizophora mucronata TaxID=61149 RepID=A0A2P2L5F7_RHIMU
MESGNILKVASSSPAMAAQLDGEGGRMRKNPTLICAPIMRETVDKMLIDTHKAKASGADLVEIRLDSLKTFNPLQHLTAIIKHSPLPTLFTYRPTWEGGQYDGDEKKRLEVLQLAMESGADYIDVELKVAHEFNESIHGKKPKKCKVIVSSHNYQNTPSVEDLGNLVATIQAAGADIVKIATTALDITDVARLFQITVHSQVRSVCDKHNAFLTMFLVQASSSPEMCDLMFSVGKLLNMVTFEA